MGMSPPQRRAADQAPSAPPPRRKGRWLMGSGLTRPQRALCLLMVLGVVLRGLVPVIGRMQSMRMRNVSVMARLFVIARVVVLRRFAMMVRGGLMMLGRELVVAATLVAFVLMSLSSRSGPSTAVRLRPESDRRMNAAILSVDEPLRRRLHMGQRRETLGVGQRPLLRIICMTDAGEELAVLQERV